MKRWMLLLLLISSAAPVPAELYRWVDADGKVHYSDQLPPPNIKQVERKKLGDKPSEAALPYTLQQAVKNFPVTLYVNECGDVCKQARALLAKRGIPHTEKDPTDPAVYDELKKVAGAAEVPVIQIGRRVVRGFEEGQWNSALDIAGYPQSAMIPPRPPAKPKPVQSATPVPEVPAQGETPPAAATPPAQ
jgi:glutaredoxin